MNSGARTAHEPAVEASTESGQKWSRILAAVAVVALSVLVGLAFGNNIFNAIIDAKDFLRAQPLSLLGYFAIFTVMSVFFMPYAPFCIAIGFVFGISMGLAIEMLNILISSSFIFVLSRYLIKKRVEEMIGRSEGHTAHTLWRGLIAYMGRDWREAAKINLLLCFIPMPYGMNRYLFSLTNVPFVQYNLFFMIGMVPNTVLNLLIGAALAEASEEDGVDSLRLAGTLLATLGILTAIWYAKSVAQQVLAESEANGNRASQGISETPTGASEVVLTVTASSLCTRCSTGAILEQKGGEENMNACTNDAGSVTPDTFEDGINHEAVADAGGNDEVQEDGTAAQLVVEEHEGDEEEAAGEEHESDKVSLLR